MARYKEKASVIEATQVSKETPRPYEREGAIYSGDIGYANAKLDWHEMKLVVREGDYVVQRVDGSCFPLAKEDFEAYYEPEG